MQLYVARHKFDSRRFSIEKLNVDIDFCHEPQLEDYWENCDDEFEVRKRLWSRFIVQQIVTMGLSMNVFDVQEDEGEEVVDPEFNEKIKGQPIQEVDWDRKGDDNI